MRIYTKHNIVHHDPEITEDQVMVYVGAPSSSTTPYDVYARYVAKDARIALMRSQVKGEVHTCYRRIASVGVGSGPGGSVRFGDDMIPPEIYVVVDKADETKATCALHEYRRRRYLHKPISIAGNMWYDKGAPVEGTPSWCHTQGAWIRGGTWPHVVGNALFIAQVLGLDTTKLEKYQNKRRSRSVSSK
jgi:hypothetical protein